MRPANVTARGRCPGTPRRPAARRARRRRAPALAGDLARAPGRRGVVHADDEPHVGRMPPDQRAVSSGLQVVVGTQTTAAAGPGRGGQRLPRAAGTWGTPQAVSRAADRVGVVRTRHDDDHGDTRGVQVLDGAQPDAAQPVDDECPESGGPDRRRRGGRDVVGCRRARGGNGATPSVGGHAGSVADERARRTWISGHTARKAPASTPWVVRRPTRRDPPRRVGRRRQVKPLTPSHPSAAAGRSSRMIEASIRP